LRYIDTHAHLGGWFDADRTLAPEQFVARQERAGITRSVVSSIAALYTELVTGNEWTIRQAEIHGHLLVWLVLNPLKEAESLELLERFGRHPKVVGFKIHPVSHEYPATIKAAFRLLERLVPFGLPVLSHAQNESYASPDQLRRLAESVPSLCFVAAHFGAGQTGQTLAAIDAIQDCATGNLYTDMGTARAIRTGMIAQVVRGIGADRVLFGTDAPLYESRAFTALLQAAEITDQERELIAHGNAERLLLAPRGLT
jgi:uncharacterized protein